jgi:hypothetical protein
MVFLISPYGNHSNQLIQTAQFESFCEENGIPFRNLVRGDLKKMIRYRYSALADGALRFILRAGRKTKLVKYFDVDDFASFDEMAAAVEKYGRNKILLVSGFLMRNNDLLDKYRTAIIDRYKNEQSNGDTEFLAKEKASGRVIIGLHIRHGDYRDYEGGRYFYPVEQYIQWAKDFIVANRMTNPLVAVFSDQKLSKESFEGFADVFVSRNPYNVDYELMGCCNYLIGPPSTFTQWASYTYQVPYYHIESRDISAISLPDFRVAFCD